MSLVAPPRSFSGPARGYLPVGWQGGPDQPPPVHLSSTEPRRTTPSYISVWRTGLRTVLDRLVRETKAVGGDGVVDLHVEHTEEEAETGTTVWAFLATGTAVRSTGSRHTEQPFTSALSATETAVALRSGWLPLAYLSCPVAAARWVEPESFQRQRRRAANGEIEAYTETVTACRRQAVDDLTAAARGLGADAAVVAALDLKIGHQRSIAEAYVLATGTALLRWPLPGRQALPVLPVGNRS